MYLSYIHYISCNAGLLLTKGNVQTVLQRSQVFESKSWHKTLRCFSLPEGDVEGDLSPTQKSQYLSENWLQKEEECHWWRLGMKLIRCCRRKEIGTVHELMKCVAIYNNQGMFSINKFLGSFEFRPLV